MFAINPWHLYALAISERFLPVFQSYKRFDAGIRALARLYTGYSEDARSRLDTLSDIKSEPCMTHPVLSRRLALRLTCVLVIVFACGLALPWLYRMLSGNDNNGDPDFSRQIEVQFSTANSAGMAWAFYPRARQLQVNPGAVNEMIFVAQNPTDKPMKAQAVPGISPGKAAAWFHKTECFCFTQQTLQPGERIEMPVRFIVDRNLPGDVKHLTLAYTLFDVTAP
ncbi:Cytochrome C oxidase assembly protein [Pseudomonas syringae pv. helianthi]|uniref:Cytochrome c oxidase assembly protein CtaG n=2 Tax=Pseudomonas syringae group genomosp. 7 TaxID=251699 RepID=A0A3M6D0G1_9PSED|nr:Cytochrome C oxidase assembly protein [Pseudomonas syringae pv. helianthi]